ncbi:hypothetical protein THAOC_17012 [Thalassiosira oceanica]|uniref:Uncharacterized protein n=1 Tax=Thalassiosira oceanica TaxID=159749 RepID=K0S8B1_THAOC|nr:hypothetical protein THAOC_17012 [Thalassiosira oceanica]|eukprot:EJK62378.1 hypothetical protein THAOC_17012 [Thalassiosira oceanica]
MRGHRLLSVVSVVSLASLAAETAALSTSPDLVRRRDMLKRATAGLASASSAATLLTPRPSSAAPPFRHNGRGAGILPRDGREVGGDRHGPLAGQPELDTAGDRAGEVPQEDRREDVRGVLVPALLEAEGALREGGLGDHRLRGVRPEGIQIPVRNVHREEGRRVSHVEVRQRQGTGRRDGTGRHREGERIPETGDVRPEPRGGRATPRGRGGLSVGLGEGRRFGKPDRERPGIAGGPRASLMLH